MDELTLDGQVYVSSKRAAKLTGYAKDYVGQLCREGRVTARLVGRSWYVLEESLKEHQMNDKRKEPMESRVELPVNEVLEDSGTKEVTQVPEEIPDIASSKAVEEPPRYLEDVPQEISTVEELPENHTEQVTRMQDAWSAWFNQPARESGVAEEVPERMEAIPEPVYKVQEAPQEVALHRIVEVPAPRMDIDVVHTTEPVILREEEYAPSASYAPTRKEGKPVAAYALIASIVVLFVLMTAIITGLSDSVFASEGASPLLDILRGETRIEK